MPRTGRTPIDFFEQEIVTHVFACGFYSAVGIVNTVAGGCADRLEQALRNGESPADRIGTAGPFGYAFFSRRIARARLRMRQGLSGAAD